MLNEANSSQANSMAWKHILSGKYYFITSSKDILIAFSQQKDASVCLFFIVYTVQIKKVNPEQSLKVYLDGKRKESATLKMMVFLKNISVKRYLFFLFI